MFTGTAQVAKSLMPQVKIQFYCWIFVWITILWSCISISKNIQHASYIATNGREKCTWYTISNRENLIFSGFYIIKLDMEFVENLNFIYFGSRLNLYWRSIRLEQRFYGLRTIFFGFRLHLTQLKEQFALQKPSNNGVQFFVCFFKKEYYNKQTTTTTKKTQNTCLLTTSLPLR